MAKPSKRIPRKIDDTIFSSTLEIRFLLNIPDNELLGRLLKVLLPKFPKFEPVNTIPAPLRALDVQFKYAPEYQFSNDELLINVSKQSIAFEYPTAYKGWDHFQERVSAVLASLDTLKIFEHTERIGLRYINVLGETLSVKDVLEVQLNVELDGFTERNITFRNELSIGNTSAIINILQNGIVNRNNSQKHGFIVDVDVFTAMNIPIVGSGLLPLINDLHEKEKSVFFNILKQQFIDSKNPVY